MNAIRADRNGNIRRGAAQVIVLMLILALLGVAALAVGTGGLCVARARFLIAADAARLASTPRFVLHSLASMAGFNLTAPLRVLTRGV